MKNALVFQTDFGLADGAVSAMYGVAHKVDSELKIFNLTHDIPQYNIWEASYRLIQTIMYWAEGTVFVSVVDPGVGTDRKSVVVKTATGQYIVTPDNGTLTHVKRMCGIVEAREIDENIVINYLNECYFKIKESLSRCGNIIYEINSKSETEQILNSFFNPQKNNF